MIQQISIDVFTIYYSNISSVMEGSPSLFPDETLSSCYVGSDKRFDAPSASAWLKALSTTPTGICFGRPFTLISSCRTKRKRNYIDGSTDPTALPRRKRLTIRGPSRAGCPYETEAPPLSLKEALYVLERLK